MNRDRLRILTFTTLFPNPAQPLHGLFVAERLRHMIRSGMVEAQVVAPVPWFPSSDPRFGRYAHFARVPRRSLWEGIEVLHPPYPIIPGPAWYASPFSMALWARRALRRLDAGRGWDLIDAHYYFPDGVAAVLLGRSMDKPVIVTARGTDINLIPQFALARRLVSWAGRSAAGSIAVSEGIKRRMIDIGIPAERIRVLRNGVDLQRFRPLDRDVARRRVGATGRTLLSVGQLIELKGHELVIGALPRLPGWSLIIVGAGPLEATLRRSAEQAGCGDRVRLVGAVPQEELIQYYNAADALILASSREGMANVLLEAMACGTPVFPTDVSGAREIVRQPETGQILEERSVSAIVAAVGDLERTPRDRAQVRQHAMSLGWGPTVTGAIEEFQRALTAQREHSCVET
jgi:teichuronic acid biosynthesis glycosyltransferase TuaC